VTLFVRMPTLLAISVAGFLASPAAAQWSATIMHPSGAYASEIRALAPGQQAGGSVKPSFSEDYHAALWNGPGPWTSLVLGGGVVGMTVTQQVGAFGGRASLWSGTPASRVDLNPPGVAVAVAYGVSGNQQVGYLNLAGNYNAAMWSGTAASYVSLHPSGATNSAAYATDGTRQWGFVTGPTPEGIRGTAGYWTGSASSFVSVNPGPAWNSAIQGVGGGQQVGYSLIPGMQEAHASIWAGTAQSWQDIHPFPGFGASFLYATTGTMQVGSSHVLGSTFPHAGVWSGTAASFIDLNQFLPSGYGGESLATSIIVDGGITYVGGYARGPSGEKEAVLWTLVPGPGNEIVALAGLAAWSGRRRRPR